MIQEITYAGWKRNLRLQGPTTELIITLDVGPRIIRYALHQGKNVFVELSEQLGGAEEPEWKIRGGHRFWTAPEGAHSYAVDNEPVTYKKISDAAVEIAQPAEKTHGFQKTMRVEFDFTRLNRDVVVELLRSTGIDIVEEIPLAPPPAPKETAAALPPK